MFNLLKLLILASLVSIVALFLNENSVELIIEISNRKIKTTIFLAGLALIITLIISYVIIKSLYSIISLPFTLKKNYLSKIDENRVAALMELMISIDQHDEEKTNKIISFLLSSKVPFYFKSWLNYKKNHDKDIKKSIAELIEYKETAQLAIMKLIEEEINQGEYLKAINHLQDYSKNSKLKNNKYFFSKSVIIYFKAKTINIILFFYLSLYGFI